MLMHLNRKRPQINFSVIENTKYNACVKEQQWTNGGKMICAAHVQQTNFNLQFTDYKLNKAQTKSLE